jgi:hypothetical protein
MLRRALFLVAASAALLVAQNHTARRIDEERWTAA